MSTSSMFSQNPRSIISPRVSRARDGHERKRSRLNTETTPFDSVDYWIQFDQDQQQQQLQKQQQQQQQQQQLLLQQQQLQQLQQQQLQLQQAQRQRQQQQLKQQQKKKEKQSQETANAADATNTASSSQICDDEFADAVDWEIEGGGNEGEEGFSYSSIDLADQLSKIDSIAPTDVPQREGLYSTPLSWERPQMGLRLDSMLGFQTPTLSEAEQRRLIAIAMNPTTPMGGLGNNMGPNFNSFPMFGPGLGSASVGQMSNNDLMSAMMAPSASTAAQAQPSSSSSAQPSKQAKSEKGKEKPKSADRTAHNDIERKYRTNLKDRIAELRDAVPSLRTIPENSVDDGDGEGEGSNQAGRAPKVSKGTVLTKATDYIHHLEKKNKAIMQQHQELSRRLQAFEQLLNATARPTFQMPNYSRTLFDPRAFC
ncbi:hypothetical protein SBRCBS47491_001319 [Sporothrix bragantina]|uniref:BHLH domain-containing protein n=1 Tax=Sporothrix bragantina TaxID=671064 RepID=A0ABP0AY58_9PEZI